MRPIPAFVLTLLAMLVLACQPNRPACPTPAAALPSPAPSPTGAPTATPIATTVEINRRAVAVDQLVEGQLCDGTWRGTVYVSCNVRVRPWTEQPDFLKGCGLRIEPDTIVYVAAHNNAPYYNGCSCHTGEVP